MKMDSNTLSGLRTAVLCATLSAILSPVLHAEVALSLHDALTMAGKHARLVQAAEHDSLAAERGLSAARAEWFPQISVTGNALGFNPDKILGIGPIQIPDDWNSLYMANFSLQYPIFTGGRRTNTIGRSREDVGAASARLDAERLRNSYECRRAYLSLLMADRMVSAAEASLRRVELIGKDTVNLFAAGMADSVDLLETRLSLHKAMRSVETARNSRRNASAVLARIVGTPPEEPIMPTGEIPEPEGPSAADLPPPDPEARPELLAIDRRLAALRYERSLVRGNYWPTISTLGGYAVVRPDIGQPGVEWQSQWWVGLTFSWELNLGARESDLSGQALERIHSMELTRSDTAQSFLLRARIALNDIDEAFKLYRLSSDEYGIAADRYRLASGKTLEGAMSVNRLYELEAELAGTEQEMEAARLRYFLAVTDYLYAVGSDSLLEEM